MFITVNKPGQKAETFSVVCVYSRVCVYTLCICVCIYMLCVCVCMYTLYICVYIYTMCMCVYIYTMCMCVYIYYVCARRSTTHVRVRSSCYVGLVDMYVGVVRVT
jgi:hypothetical protein